MKEIMKSKLLNLALLLVTMLVITACGGGGGGSSDSGGGGNTTKPPVTPEPPVNPEPPAPVLPTSVKSFSIAPQANGFMLRWTNPARDDIKSVTIEWDAYEQDGITRRPADDGSKVTEDDANTGNNTAGNLEVTVADDGLNMTLRYTFNLQLEFDDTATPAAPAQVPETQPTLPRALGDDADDNGIADFQEREITDFVITPNATNITYSWTNPRLGDIDHFNLSFQAYNEDGITRNSSADGFIIINSTTGTANRQVNLGELATTDPAGLRLRFIFLLQVNFTGDDTLTTLSPRVPFPNVPRAFGVNADQNSFADFQENLVTNTQVSRQTETIGISWANPYRDNIVAVILSWDAYSLDGETRLAGDGEVTPSAVDTSATATNTYNISIADGLAGDRSYKFSLQLQLADGTIAPQELSPNNFLVIGADDDGDGTPNVQDPDFVYTLQSVTASPATGRITLAWRNAPLNPSTLQSINISYFSLTAAEGGTGTDRITGEVILDAPEYITTDLTNPSESLSYTITGLADNTYNVSVTPTLIDALTTAGVTTTGVMLGDIIVAADDDGDRVLNPMDVDVDGDGLIEISEEAELRAVRHNVNGTGLDLDNTDNDIAAGGNSDGCPVTGCIGYELTNNITLSDAFWVPIGGRCHKPTADTREGNFADNQCINPNSPPFTGIFEGNGYSIDNMKIDLVISSNPNGLGMFAGTNNGEIRNLHLTNFDATNEPNRESPQPFLIGGIAGYTLNSQIINSSVQGNIGAFLGARSSKAENTPSATIRGFRNINIVGGLVGSAYNTQIYASHFNGSVIAENNHGGLIGIATGTNKISFSAAFGPVAATAGLSGSFLVSVSRGSLEIIGSYADFDYSNNGQNLPAHSSLVSNFDEISMLGAYVKVGRVGETGAESTGSLVGVRGTEAEINASYVYNVGFNSIANIGGSFIAKAPHPIIGLEPNDFDTLNLSINDVYWDFDSVVLRIDPVLRFDNTSLNPEGQDGARGLAYPTRVLQNSNFSSGSIYENWGKYWCHPHTYDVIRTAVFDDLSPMMMGYERLWDLGGATDYPALNCHPISHAEQRSRSDRSSEYIQANFFAPQPIGSTTGIINRAGNGFTNKAPE